MGSKVVDSASGQATPVVKVPKLNVSFRGHSPARGIAQYLGIRYAQETSGKNRFRPPQPYKYPEGTTVDATSSLPPCMQLKEEYPPFIDARTEVSEDSLGLSITAPTDIPFDTKLPVLVWIHGGGLKVGAGDDALYDPLDFIKHSIEVDQPVIYVSLNHRLGIFGFAAADSLNAEGAGNNGLRDQRMALEWIAENIEAFGGNASRITVYGQSAGGVTALLHTMMFDDKPLPFQHVFAMSGPPGNSMDMVHDRVSHHTNAVAALLNCTKNNGTEPDFDLLREVDADKLLEVSDEYACKVNPTFGNFVFVPSVDGDSLKSHPTELLKQGRFASIPIVAGWTHKEGSNAIPIESITDENSALAILENFFKGLTTVQKTRLFELYPESDFTEEARVASERDGITASPHWYRLVQIFDDILIRSPTIAYALKLHERREGRAWLYAFNQSVWSPLYAKMGTPHVGPEHGADIPYSRGTIPTDIDDRKNHVELAERFMNMILAFAYTGDPSTYQVYRDWAPSIAADEPRDSATTMPAKLTVQVFGGPLGDGVVVLENPHKERVSGIKAQAPQPHLERDQDDRKEERQRLFDKEKMFSRCEYISSLYPH